jgi:hypothetical protein
MNRKIDCRFQFSYFHVFPSGPAETDNLTAFQVKDVIRAANRKGYDDVVFAAYGFDAAAL